MEQSISNYIEAMIFTSESAISIQEITMALQSFFNQDFIENEIQNEVEKLQNKYASEHSAIQIIQLNGGFQFLTKNEFHPILNHLHAQRAQKKLSVSALETLAIIAYKQSVTKLEIEQIRRVNCDYSIQKLLDKELITIAGKAESPGRPILYKTSSLFMDYFGINDLRELPQLKDLQNLENSIGDSNL